MAALVTNQDFKRSGFQRNYPTPRLPRAVQAGFGSGARDRAADGFARSGGAAAAGYSRRSPIGTMLEQACRTRKLLQLRQ